MKAIKPDYYDRFKCIAGECDFTCCQCWDITMDDEAVTRWSKLASPVCKGKTLTEHITNKDGQDVIKLNKDKICPLLDENGLCKVVSAYGEGTLSDTCHTFPREKRIFSGRVEHNLSIGCKSVLDLLLKSESWKLIEVEAYAESNGDEVNDIYFKLREEFLKLICDNSLEITDILKSIFYFVSSAIEEDNLDMVLADIKKDGAGLVRKISEALLKEDRAQSFAECNEIMLDIMVNYRQKKIYKNYIEKIAVSAEKIAEKDYEDIDEKLLDAFANEWKKYDRWMRLVLCEEFYDSMISTEGYDAILMKIQWLAMEFAVIKQWTFNTWYLNGKLDDENIKECILVIFRMMGYCEEDVFEYLEESFENPVWEIGYLNYILWD